MREWGYRKRAAMNTDKLAAKKGAAFVEEAVSSRQLASSARHGQALTEH